MADIFANSVACYPRATCHIAEYCHLANSMSWSPSCMSHCRVLPLGEFTVIIPEPYAMSSHSRVSHCRVGLLPLGEFTVMIPEPPATLQGAATWRNQCHDCATLQGVHLPYWKSFFAIFYFFCFFNAVWALTSGGFRIVSDTLVCTEPLKPPVLHTPL